VFSTAVHRNFQLEALRVVERVDLLRKGQKSCKVNTVLPSLVVSCMFQM